MRGLSRRAQWTIVAAITAAAAVLRLWQIGKVPPDPFYDAAVRSMTLSWHNFFFGAFEPSASVSIDKPPVDLWLQVASVKLLGFSSTTLKLPEALAGIVSVPLLYEAVRRLWSPVAGIAAAAGLAALPIEVITARSDTMDAVMMALLVIALLLVARALETGRTGWLLGGAAALGLAFDVKLLESLVAVPGLVLLAAVGMPGTLPRRAMQLAAAGAVYVVVALAWLTATLAVPAHDRPYAIGSTNGSAWNAAFVFNGKDRLSGKSPEPSGTVYEPGHVYPTATQAQRDHIPIVPSSPTRLLARIGPLSGQRLGMEILIGLILGIPALLLGLRGPPVADPLAGGRSRRRAERAGAGAPGAAADDGAADAAGAPGADADAGPGDEPQQEPGGAPGEDRYDAPPASRGGAELPRLGGAGGPPAEGGGADAVADPHGDPVVPLRIRRATAAGIGLWMLTGLVLFSHMARLHPRYVEGFTPAVAAMLGIGLAWASSPRGRLRLAALAVAMLVTVYYAERLLFEAGGVWWIVLAGALVALGAALAARRARSPRARGLLGAATLAAALVAVLAVGVKTDIRAIRDKVSAAGFVGQLPGDVQHALSSYLKTHNHGARYELAAESATQIGSLIVQDAKPIAVLTTYNARVYTPIAKLKRMIAAGQVRYAYLSTFCGHKASSVNAACAAPVLWIRAHGTDVSRAAGLRDKKVLFLLPGAKP
jgi:4-amino-4-deoxy-L-arabinose transferase-like glycosyltransferase